MSWEFWVRVVLFNGPPVVGLVYLFALRRRSPRAMWPALSALTLLILAYGAASLPFWFSRLGAVAPDPQATHVAFQIANWTFALGHAAGLSLLIWSVAVDRRLSPCTTDE